MNKKLSPHLPTPAPPAIENARRSPPTNPFLRNAEPFPAINNADLVSNHKPTSTHPEPPPSSRAP